MIRRVLVRYLPREGRPPVSGRVTLFASATRPIALDARLASRVELIAASASFILVVTHSRGVVSGFKMYAIKPTLAIRGAYRLTLVLP